MKTKESRYTVYAVATKQTQDGGKWFPWVGCVGLSHNSVKKDYELKYGAFKADSGFQIKRFYISTK